MGFRETKKKNIPEKVLSNNYDRPDSADMPIIVVTE